MNRVLFTICLLLFLALDSLSQHTSFDNPTDYNNFIVNAQNQLIVQIIDYNISNLHNSNLEENEQKRAQIVHQISISIEKLNTLSPYKGDNKLRDVALEVFLMYKETCDTEFNEINLLRKEREISYEAMKKYISAQDKAEENLKEAGEKFLAAQKEFAKKHRVVIQDQKEQHYFEEVSSVNQYSRHILLEYFRVSKSDALFLDAINTQQTSILEEKRMEILYTAELSLKSLNEITPYNNDTTYKAKAVELVGYHRHLAVNEYTELIQILQKKGRTQQDINRYNELVTTINSTAQNLLSELNKENKEMLKRNIPVY